MNMGGGNLVEMRPHGGFDAGVICKGQKKIVAKLMACM